MTISMKARQPAALAMTATLAMLATTSLAAGIEQAPRWEATLGAGVAYVPQFVGSEQSWARPMPLVGAKYGRLVFGDVPGATSPASFGIRAVETDAWSAGTFMSYDLGDPRRDSKFDHLQGLGDIKASGHAGLFASYQVGWLQLTGSAQSDIGGKDQGVTASFQAMAQLPLGQRLMLAAGPSVTWGNAEHMRTWFAVDATQSANSGLAQHTAKAGVRSVDVAATAMFQLTERWSVAAHAAASRLQRDAAHSPIVEQATQATYATFFTYRY